MDIRNESGGRHLAVPMRDRTGRERLVAMLKYTFAVGPAGTVEALGAAGTMPAVLDTYNGEDGGAASIRKPSALFDDKPGTDVILLGHAHAPPRGGTVKHVDVSLRMGPVAKTVRAHGLRTWAQGAFGGLSPGPALPVREPVPLLYELAWGGLDLSDPARPFGDPRNSVGRGAVRNWKALVGQPAAQLEDPANPVGGRDNVAWGFGAIHRHWQPRASFAGTYDEAWMATKMPLLPDDFDPRFHVTVPPDQWSELPLRGDEPVEIAGATPEGVWRFQLPRLHPGFTSYAFGARSQHATFLDTVLIDADARQVELTFRALVPLPRKYEQLEWVHIVEKRVL